jgi:predicted Zn-dependent peptidase
VVLAGNVDSGVFGEAEKYFSGFNLGKENALPKVEVVLNSDKRKEIIKPVEQGHFAMAVPALDRSDPRKYIFKILNLILSGNSSSRLYQKIREERGLAYYIFPVSESFVEAGYWGVQSGVKMDKLDEAMEIIRDEISNIGNNLTFNELKLAKDCLIGRIELRMDESDYWADLAGERLLLDNEMIDLEAELEKYNKVSKKEVSDLAKDIFKKDEIREVLIKKK